MPLLRELRLSEAQKQALSRLKTELTERYPVTKTMIFGSVARGTAEKESDLDVLVLTKRPMRHREKHEIYAVVTKINLAYNSNISALVVDERSWETGLYSLLPIKEEVSRDGVAF